jgi:hypothetical protein
LSQLLEQTKLKSAIERFKALEEEGRRRAYERDAIPKSDEDFLFRLSAEADQMAGVFHDFDLTKESIMADMIETAARYGARAARYCEFFNIPRSECIVAKKVQKNGETDWVTVDGDHSWAYDALWTADNKSMQIIGRRCSYLRGELDDYNEAAFLNDITSCFHTLMDIYRDKLGKWNVEGKCVWSVV